MPPHDAAAVYAVATPFRHFTLLRFLHLFCIVTGITFHYRHIIAITATLLRHVDYATITRLAPYAIIAIAIATLAARR